MRSCWTCNHQSVCKGLEGIDKVVSNFHYLANDDTPKAATGTKTGIYKAVAAACTQYQKSEKES